VVETLYGLLLENLLKLKLAASSCYKKFAVYLWLLAFYNKGHFTSFSTYPTIMAKGLHKVYRNVLYGVILC